MRPAEVVQAPAVPSLPRVAEYCRTRDRIDDEIARIRGEVEANIADLTSDLQAKIRDIREIEESIVAEKLAELQEERGIAEDLYRGEVERCVKAGVMYDDRYELVNKTKVNHPIVPRRFYETFGRDLFEKAVNIQKNTAKAVLIAELKIKGAEAEKRLEAVIVDEPSGDPQWELEVRSLKGERV